MIKYSLSLCLAVASASMLVACGGGQPQYIPQAAAAASGAQVVQAPQEDHTALWAAGAGLLGYTLGRQGSNQAAAAAAPTIVKRTTVVNQTVVQKKIVNVTQPRVERPIQQSRPTVTRSAPSSRRR